MIDPRGNRTRAYYSKDKIKEKIFSPFSSFTVVMFYNVTRNTKLVNTEPLLLEEVQH